ncbi:hypothetical protein V2S66_03395 [Streptomyces sp. V4-01]|uniref:Uncharacterized protein n=1 Tax=Actinacidiphila polyblastidii TaxID=3110430 RepID=A0ABU7P5C4_9ACTN|nr:hypothetical protein [Streptomyces sp. V4-01]
MGWFTSDKELAATKYAGRESATDRAARLQHERGSMGSPHRTARDADRAGWSWWDRRR